MRYFIELAFDGRQYAGWQRQDNASTVQHILEDVLSAVLREEVRVVGCGRTDAGVHARQFFAHMNTMQPDVAGYVVKFNQMLPADIAIRRIFEVEADKHARYDAVQRTYEYHMTSVKDPFKQGRAFYFHALGKLPVERLQEAATLLLDYDEFFPFCKTKTDVKTVQCRIDTSVWKGDRAHMVYTVSANRFLRGMVRLIVGMCLNVAQTKMDIDDVREALDRQERLPMPWSVPAEGLFLTDVRY